MQHNEEFRKVVKEKFQYDIKSNYLPDQIYINRLISSLQKVDANSYNQCQVGFISEFNYLKNAGILQSIETFVNGCLKQLFWINSILESGKCASTGEELDEVFDYITPIISGNPWTLYKVSKKGVFFRGEEPSQDSRVIINSEIIIEITLALSKVTKLYSEHIAAEKSKPGKSVVVSSSKTKGSSLFKSLDLQNKCLNVLKNIKYPILDPRGHFLGKLGMIAAIVLWYEKCKVLGFISNDIEDTNKAIANEIMKIIPDLHFIPNNFSQPTKANKYKVEIEEKLELLSPK